MNEDEIKEYKASLWVREHEEIEFVAQITTGSHVKPTIFLDGDSSCKCAFPFKRNVLGEENKLYYGCIGNPRKCPVDTDSNFEPIGSMVPCDDLCPLGGGRNEQGSNTSTLQEGASMTLTEEYQLPTISKIKWKIKFDTKGKIYNLTLVLANQHTKLDVSTMTWTITCGNPVIPADWSLKYNWKQRPGVPVQLKIKIGKDLDLPTKPTLRITKVDGYRVTAFDLASIPNPNASTIPFGLTYNKDDDVINCYEVEDDTDCHAEYTFEEMGLGKNLKSRADDGSIPDLGEMIVATVTFDGPDDVGRSHGFAVNLFNQLSNISHDYSTGAVVEKDILFLDAAPDGVGDWVKRPVPQWQFFSVETFAKFEGTIQVEFQYTSHGNPKLYDLDLSDGTWYLPGSSVPAFSILFAKGTARRVQYTLNNTDSEGYQPPPCVMDWPKGDITPQGTMKYTIKHCDGPVSLLLKTTYLNHYNFDLQTEGEYEATLSAFNP